jgi:phytoene dehydrogenase-like protein
LRAHGGSIDTGVRVSTLAELPPARVYLFDTSPAQLADIAEPILPAGYVRRLRRYRYGPGVFKLDWALDGPIPWSDPRCLQASTVHVGGSLEEIAAAEAAVWRGELRATLQSWSYSRASSITAPAEATGYAYCHYGRLDDRSHAGDRRRDRPLSAPDSPRAHSGPPPVSPH